MGKRIEIVGAKPKKIEVVDQPKRRIEPAELAAALGANPAGGETAGNLDLIALAEIGTQLLNRLRSSGGRPALADATEICRVPLSAEDLKALEKITDQMAQSTGAKPSPGQVASIIVRGYLTSTTSEESGSFLAKHNVREQIDAVIAWLPRFAEIASEAGDLQKRAKAIEAAVKAIKADLDGGLGKLLALLPFERSEQTST